MIVRKNYTFEEIIHRWYPVMNFTDIISQSEQDMVVSGGPAGIGDEFQALQGQGVGGGVGGVVNVVKLFSMP